MDDMPGLIPRPFRQRLGESGTVGLFLWSWAGPWRVALGFFSHFFIEALHSASDGARAKSPFTFPNVFLGGLTAQLQIRFAFC
jgi:hypothetical protein